MKTTSARVIDYYGDDLDRAVYSAVQRAIRECPPTIEAKSNQRWLVYGIKGLAELLGCTLPKAQSIKNSGLIDKAIYQIDRKIIVDAEKALELIQKSNLKRR